MFPIPQSRIAIGFTTSNILNTPHVAVVALSDKELGVHKVTSATTHLLVQPPIPVDGDASRLAWEAVFPAGSINPGNKSAPPGGFGFYLRGPPAFAQALQDSSVNQEVIMGYDVLFEEDFQFRKGGKLPGIYGGVGESAYGCTGGRQHDRCKCFNLRLMWRDNGVGELYAYVPQHARNSERLKEVPPRSIQHPDYGFSVGRGAWKFQPGRWTRVMERVKLNDMGQENGEIEVFIDGISVILASGLVLRTDEGREAHVQGLHFQTFFGGHTPDWASPKEQRAWFANISGAILKPALARPAGLHDEL
ncbi:polysaccharide lyase family 14 protein [Trametes sanguinea]|nr:polysaccharide lyase family 14 protein [Trametes sanguinea]